MDSSPENAEGLELVTVLKFKCQVLQRGREHLRAGENLDSSFTEDDRHFAHFLATPHVSERSRQEIPIKAEKRTTKS